MHKITFILPGTGRKPVGGVKVVYEYANNLIRLGNDVTIIHPAIIDKKTKILTKIIKTAIYILFKINNNYLPRNWFKINKNIKMRWVLSPKTSNIPDSDFIIATAWITAEWVQDYPESKGQKLYLIQHLETCMGPEDRVMKTWEMPMQKIVISRWLQNICRDLSEKCTYIPNGLDFEAFNIDNHPKNRNPLSIIMLYHKYEWKGTRDGLNALNHVRKTHKNIKVILFGTTSPKDIPDWVDYHRNPSQALLRKLYNSSAIFIAPSWSEGWGLPASEAMMCGCAVVGTDIGGHREFMDHGITAMTSPPREFMAMSNNILELISDQKLRIHIAEEGNKNIQKFTWKKSSDTLNNTLNALKTPKNIQT